jgi:integrase
MYRGKRYTVACSVLGAPATQEGSRKAANDWWLRKRAEIDSAGRPEARVPTPLEQLALAYANVPQEQWQEALRNCDETSQMVIEGETPLDPDVRPINPLNVSLLLFMNRVLMSGEPLPEHLARLLPPARAQQLADGVKAVRGEPAATPDKTVKAHIEQWVSLQHAKVASGRLSADRSEGLRRALNHFRDYLGANSVIEAVDAAKIQGFYRWCIQKVEQRQNDPAGKAGWSNVYAQKVFDVARVFVRHLWQMGQIEQLPRNIDSQEYRFRIGVKAVVTWTPEEFQTALKAATGQLRLHLLLAANCGFGQRDISDLVQTEVDWEAGRIIRKRSKTSDHKTVPTVNYLLWPETFRLLKEYRKPPEESERVLLTKSGEPWTWEKIVDGKLKSSDNIATNYSRLRAKLKGFNKPFKALRKTGATLLEKSEFSRFSQMYLCHSPGTVKDRHYVDSSQLQPQFDAAILWLGKELGQVGTSVSPQT